MPVSAQVAARPVSATAALPAVVLVHGAFADGSGWSHVIPLLETAGYTVAAVQNPLTSFADDVATTKRVIDAQTLRIATPAGGGTVLSVSLPASQ